MLSLYCTGGIQFCFLLDSPVVIVIDIIIDCSNKFLKGLELLLMSIEHLILHPTKERLHNAVIMAIPLSGHRLCDAMLLKLGSIVGVLILPALIWNA